MRDRGEDVSMNQTLKLLKIIGSPFASRQKRYLPESRSEALVLYTYATKNKIGLLYLEALMTQGKLEEFELKRNYEEEKRKHDEQLITASRISELFNSFCVNYAIFKSIIPFPAVPNDVDIIHFGSDEEYKKAVDIMLQSDYTEVKGPVDEGSQLMFHDARTCEHLDTQKKDIYDIDLYQEVAASYVLYLNKRKLAKHATEIDIMGNKIKLLRPEAELVALIIHSIIPEMLCTLLVYYATLYHLVKMDSTGINIFIDIARENNVTFSVRAHCSLVAELHKAAHGFIPEKIEEVMAELGKETTERKNLLKNNLKMPHRYGWSTVIRTLLERAKEREFRRSAFKQVRYMSNPKFVKYIINDIIWRRRRETY